MAELDERPTDDQEVVGSTPAGSATFFLGDSEQQIILGAFGYLTPSKVDSIKYLGVTITHEMEYSC